MSVVLRPLLLLKSMDRASYKSPVCRVFIISRKTMVRHLSAAELDSITEVVRKCASQKKGAHKSARKPKQDYALWLR